MGILKNARVGMKIFLIIFSAVATLLLNGLQSLLTMNHMKLNSGLMYQDGVLPIKMAGILLANSNKIHSDLLQLMLTKDDAERQTLQQEMQELSSKNNRILDDYKKTKLDADEKSAIDTYQKLLEDDRNIQSQIVDLAIHNQGSEAYEMYLKTEAQLDSQKEQALNDLTNYNANLADRYKLENDRDVSRSDRSDWTIFAASLLIFLGLGYVVGRLITKPIRSMQLLMRKAEGGDLTVRGQYQSKDEIGRLTETFNAMFAGLQTMISRVSANSQALSAMSQELNASAEQTCRASTQIAEVIQEVSCGMERQSENMHVTGQTMDTMSYRIQEVSELARQVSFEALQASEVSREGKMAVEHSTRQMHSIETAIGHAAELIKELNGQAQHIGKVVHFISGISSQINLLSLNAAIEAARAGEQGRGFVVVSKEVRKLAEQSSAATEQITDYIRSIEDKIRFSVEAIEVGSKEVTFGVERNRAAETLFDQIHQAVNEVNHKVRDVSEAVREIASGTERITGSFQVVAEVAAAGAQQTQTVSAATEEQLASMEEMTAFARSLAHSAEELQSMVGRFNV